MKKLKMTKIVCTIGPASDDYNILNKLIKNGMNVMRLNFSHGDYKGHLQKINLAREIEEKEGIIIPVMLDTKGPEIRTGIMENNAVEIKNRTIIRISMKPLIGTKEKFSVSYSKLYDDVKEKDHLKIDDGELELEIIQKDDKNKELVCKALNTHVLKSRKGINAPSSRLSMPFISKVDEEDLKFGCLNGIDLIAASFTRRAEDVIAIKKVLKKYGKANIPVIAKIENPEGVNNIEEIIDVSDGIMVARGDLGVEVEPELVPVIQRQIIELCRKKGKPVITATQMLDSMQTHPRPTRAEVSDVALAISEGSDCIMLSAESASGLYPKEAVLMQNKIALVNEKYLNYKLLASQAFLNSEKTSEDALANSIANTAILTDATLIVSFSDDGKLSERISRSRPCAPIFAITTKREVALKCCYMWGIYPKLKKNYISTIDEMNEYANDIAHNFGCKVGENIIIAGILPNDKHHEGFMRIVTVK